MRIRWQALALLLSAGLLTVLYLNAGTVHEDCAGNTTCEMSRRDADAMGPYAVGLSCWHPPSATIAVVTQSPCKAYVADGTYIEWTTDTGWSYNQGDGEYYFGVHKSPGVAVAGWQTVAGTPWRWIKATTQPVVTDAGFVLIGKAQVASGAVTAVVELVTRRFQPGTRWAVPAGVTRLLGECPIAGRWPIWDADDTSTGTVAFASGCNIFPEWWGATGDGVTEDGLSLWGMVSGVNDSTTNALTITFGPGRTYIITGGPDWGTAPNHRAGLQIFTKSDLEIVAYNSELKVAASYGWVGDGVNPNQEAPGLHLQGARNRVRGGTYNGNLTQRTVTNVAGCCDGFEMGLVVNDNAADVLIENATFKEWGTDNMYLTTGLGRNVIRNVTFDRARRNNVSIVVTEPLSKGTAWQPITFEGCTFSHAGQYPVAQTRRPGVGMDIEGVPVVEEVRVHLLNNLWVNNRHGNLYLNASGYHHVIRGNSFLGVYPPAEAGGDAQASYPGGIVFNSGDLGGHIIQNNSFADRGLTVFSEVPDEPTIVSSNIFRAATAPITMLPVSGDPDYQPVQGWTFASNSVPNASKATDAGLEGLSQRIGYNVYRNPAEYTYDVTVAANATATLDLQTVGFEGGTYLVLVKGNNGSGTYDAVGMYLMTWYGTTLEGAWNLLPPNAAFEPATTAPDVTWTAVVGSCGRAVSRSGTILTFTNTACATPSQFGVLAYALGGGDWGH